MALSFGANAREVVCYHWLRRNAIRRRRAFCSARSFDLLFGILPDQVEDILTRHAGDAAVKGKAYLLHLTGGHVGNMEAPERLKGRSAPRSLSKPAGPVAWSRTCSKVLVCNCCGLRSNFRPRPWRGSGSKPLASRTGGCLRWRSQNACKGGVRREAFPTSQDQWLGAGPARRSWSAIAAACEAISDQDLGGGPAPSHWQAGRVVV